MVGQAKQFVVTFPRLHHPYSSILQLFLSYQFSQSKGTPKFKG